MSRHFYNLKKLIFEMVIVLTSEKVQRSSLLTEFIPPKASQGLDRVDEDSDMDSAGPSEVVPKKEVTGIILQCSLCDLPFLYTFCCTQQVFTFKSLDYWVI